MFRLILSLAVFSLWIFPCALRWRQIARACHYPVSLAETTNGYLIGAFFSNFLPTAKGGDVIRGLLLAKRRCFSVGGILATVFVERFIGLAVALLMVLFSSIMMLSFHSAFKAVFLSASALVFSLVLFILCFFHSVPRRFLSKALQKLPLPRFHAGMDNFNKVLDTCVKQPALIVSTTGFSLANQMILVASGVLIASSIPEFDAPWVSFPLVIPLNFIALLLPSIGGYGIREASFVIFFGWFGVSEEAAVLFGFFQLLFFWIFSIMGGFVFMKDRT